MAYRKLQIRRGNKADLPQLSEGEFGFVNDENKLYIGKAGGDSNQLVGGETSEFVVTSLSASGWVNGVYDFERSYSSAEYDIEMSPSGTCTKEQIETYGNAIIVGSNSANRIKALGTVPSIDIPVKLKVVSK